VPLGLSHSRNIARRSSRREGESRACRRDAQHAHVADCRADVLEENNQEIEKVVLCLNDNFLAINQRVDGIEQMQLTSLAKASGAV
jgi:hypothetical protein